MATAEALRTEELPVPVLKVPHWRVVIRPSEFAADLISSLDQCYAIVEANHVTLRGWSFPTLNPDASQRESGRDWVGSWANFLSEMEYWRFYQSGQFIHFHAFEEAIDESVRKALEESMRLQLRRTSVDWSGVKGYLSFLSLFYRVIEIFEFATRLCQSGTYGDSVSVSIGLRGVKGFVLASDGSRNWSQLYQANSNAIDQTWSFSATELVGTNELISLAAARWLFERFGWMNPPLESFREERRKFMQGVA